MRGKAQARRESSKWGGIQATQIDARKDRSIDGAQVTTNKGGAMSRQNKAERGRQESEGFSLRQGSLFLLSR